MFTAEMIGLVAGTLTTVAFVPQVYKTWKSKSAEDVSIYMFVLFATGVASWIVYGALKRSPSVFFANSVTFIFAAIQIFLKIKYDRVNKTSKEKKSHEKV